MTNRALAMQTTPWIVFIICLIIVFFYTLGLTFKQKKVLKKYNNRFTKKIKK